MQSVITFILVLGTLIVIHEFGHFIVAKLIGIRVHEFAIGMGPALVKKRLGETVYALRLVPVGGFVKLAGMDRAETEEDEVERDDPRSFYSRPLWARVATISAGPVMNIVLAVALFSIVFSVVGVPTDGVVIGRVFPGQPAAQAGLEPGDVVVEANGQEIDSIEQLKAIISTNKDTEIELIVRRGDQLVTVKPTPRVSEGSSEPMIGIEFESQFRKAGVLSSVRAALGYTWYAVTTTIEFIGRLLSGRAGAEVTGPIGIFMMIKGAAAEAPSLSSFVLGIIQLSALISVSLGLFNLFPIPILDGGWIFLFLVEAVRGRKLSLEQEGVYRLIGLVIVMVLFVFVAVSDIFRVF